MTDATSKAWITTSWDDGHPLDLRVAAMLAEHGLAGTFYVPRRWARPTMEASALRELSDAGFELGGHTIDHVVLTDTPDAEAERQIIDSRTWLMDVTGKDCTMFCPPTGRFGARHTSMIAEAGYVGYRTVELWSTDAPRKVAGGLVEMPTTIQAQPHGKLPVLRNLAKRRNTGNLSQFVRLGLTGQWLDQLGRVAQATVERGGVVHLWGHSWEIDAFKQWDRLGEAFALLAALKDRAPSVTNGDLCRRYSSEST